MAETPEFSADPLAPARLLPIDFADIDGWSADDHAAAFAAFRISAAMADATPPKSRGLGIDGAALAAICRRALALDDLDPAGARAFFERSFVPHEVLPSQGEPFFTGYFEPEVTGSRRRSERFRVPLYTRPDDLLDVPSDAPSDRLDPEFRFARRGPGGLEPYPDRETIERGFLAGRGLELVWLEDPVDAFYIHIQGSARIRLVEGGTMRVGYAAKSGHPYTPIGRVLIERGALERGRADMAAIRGWLAANPDDAPSVMWRNRSFIFFRELPIDDPARGPVAAAGVALTAGRSLAVDRTLHTFHSPAWIEAGAPGGTPFRRLMIAQDTGSAIVGPGRGDIFFGSGDAAGALAGPLAVAGRFVLLVPRGAAPGR